MSYKKGDRVKSPMGAKGTIVANPVGIGYTVQWDNSGKIQRVQDGTLRLIASKQ